MMMSRPRASVHFYAILSRDRSVDRANRVIRPSMARYLFSRLPQTTTMARMICWAKSSNGKQKGCFRPVNKKKVLPSFWIRREKGTFRQWRGLGVSSVKCTLAPVCLRNKAPPCFRTRSLCCVLFLLHRLHFDIFLCMNTSLAPSRYINYSSEALSSLERTRDGSCSLCPDRGVRRYFVGRREKNAPSLVECGGQAKRMQSAVVRDGETPHLNSSPRRESTGEDQWAVRTAPSSRYIKAPPNSQQVCPPRVHVCTRRETNHVSAKG